MEAAVCDEVYPGTGQIIGPRAWLQLLKNCTYFGLISRSIRITSKKSVRHGRYSALAFFKNDGAA